MNLFDKLKKMKMMIVDDDEWIRDSLCLFFQSIGCTLMAFESAEAALVELQKQAFNIIIADYRLPGMNGLVFLEKVKEIYPETKEVLITAYRNEDILQGLSKVGIQDFIEKPFTSQTIMETLSSLINNG